MKLNIEIGFNKETLGAITDLIKTFTSPKVLPPLDSEAEDKRKAKNVTKAKKAVDTPSPADKKLAEVAAKKAADAERMAKEKAEIKKSKEAAAAKKAKEAASKKAKEEEAEETPESKTVNPTLSITKLRSVLVAFGECYGKVQVVDLLKKYFNKVQLSQIDKEQYFDVYKAVDSEAEILGDEGIDPESYKALLDALDGCGAL